MQKEESTMVEETTEITPLDEAQEQEVLIGTLVSETNEFAIYKLSDGTFEKRMKYKKIHTFIPTVKKDVLMLYKIMNEQDSEIAIELKKMTNKKIKIKNFYTNPYCSFDKKTGATNNGVSTIIEDIDGTYYATSSKSVYYSILKACEMFGQPGIKGYEPLEFKVKGKKVNGHEQIILEFLG